MNKEELLVLQENHTELINGIYITTDFLANFYQAGLFDSIVIEEIENEQGNAAKVTKILDLLNTRGEDAFTKFIKILEIKHDWLAKALILSLERHQMPKEEIHSDTTLTTTNLLKRQVATSQSPVEQTLNAQSPREANSRNTLEINTTADTVKPRSLESPTKSQNTPENTATKESHPGTPTKKLCSDCQKSICEQCQAILSSGEYDILTAKQTKSVRFQLGGKVVDNYNRSIIKKLLLDLCVKLKVHTNSSLENFEKQDDMTYSEETKTLEFLEEQIDILLNKVKSLEEERHQCFQILGNKGKKKTLIQLVDNLSAKCITLQKQLMEKGKSEEIYKHLKIAQSDLQEKFNLLQGKYKNLKVKNEELSTSYIDRESYHLEKQKTLKDMHDLYDKMRKNLDKSNHDQNKNVGHVDVSVKYKEQSNHDQNTNASHVDVSVKYKERSNHTENINTSHIDLTIKHQPYQSFQNQIFRKGNQVAMETINEGIHFTGKQYAKEHSMAMQSPEGENIQMTIMENGSSEKEIKQTKGEITRLKKLQETRERQKLLLEKAGFTNIVEKMAMNEVKMQLKGNNSQIKPKPSFLSGKQNLSASSNHVLADSHEKSTSIRTVKKNPFYQSRISNLF